jgi:DNA-binding CsgD family transcriptional regulator
VACLDHALTAYDRLGAVRDAARTRATLRAVGIRRGQRGARRRPQTGWDSLTPTQPKVVDLVAQGLSNPQIGDRLFVSRRTVQTHLVDVFGKLQVSSRSQLAAEAARRRG